MYANYLLDVKKLIYLIGSQNDTASLKRIFQAAETKSKYFYKCIDEVSSNLFKKIKPENKGQGIIRSDWILKIVDKYPQMIVLVFNMTQEPNGLENQKYEIMLKKVNKLFDILKTNNKEDIIMKIIVTITKQSSTNTVPEKIISYLKNYEKDVFVIPIDIFSKQVSKYRNNWLALLQKNYQKKYKKIVKRTQESVEINRRICGNFKLAILSEILSRSQKERYNQLYSSLKFKYSEITKKAFNTLKYMQVREIRSIADVTILRYIKYKIANNNRQLPELIFAHLNFFKMYSMDPVNTHPFFYYEELYWRSHFIQNLLEVLSLNDLIEVIPKVNLAQLINGLLSYLYQMSKIKEDILNVYSESKRVKLSQQIYIGRYNFEQAQITEIDLIYCGLNEIILHRLDYISKGTQLIRRYQDQNLSYFKENQVNFLNIYSIRFSLANEKFNEMILTFNNMLKVQVNRSNYFLITQLFNEIKDEVAKIDDKSKVMLFGVASLICDYFKSQDLQLYLQNFLSVNDKTKKVEKGTIFQNLAEQNHIFKLKRNSSIFALEIWITDHIILCNNSLRMKLKLYIHPQLRKKAQNQNSQLTFRFNQNNMIYSFDLKITSADQEFIERQIVVEPLKYVSKDCLLKIEQVTLFIESKDIVWLLQRNQIIFHQYDSTLFYCKMEEPQISIIGIKKVYYTNQIAYIDIQVKAIQDCKTVAKVSIREEEDGKTQFFFNIQDKKNLMNSKYNQQLSIGTVSEVVSNIFWIKSNKLGNKQLKLHFTIYLEKQLKVSWREKQLTLKTSYSLTKDLNFNVSNLFTVSKVFKQILTGNFYDNNIPINKKMMLCFYIKANDNVKIKQLGHHNNPRNVPKIKYYKNIKMRDFKMASSDDLKVSLLFQINQDCNNQIQLFLTTLFIKWQRLDSSIPIDNLYLDQQTKINAINQKLLVTFQQNFEIQKRKKSNLTVKIQNLTHNKISVYVVMDSTQNLLRIGEKAKKRQIESYQKCQINFEILAIHSGIYEFPPIKVFVDGAEVKVSTQNYLVSCL